MVWLTRTPLSRSVDWTLNDRVPTEIQEILRCHAAAIEMERAPREDDVLPLTRPIVGRSGKVYESLLIPKGTIVNVSSWGYNL
jgi:hypothetical protein